MSKLINFFRSIIHSVEENKLLNNRIKDIKEELAGYEKDGVNATEEETEEEK